MFFILAKTIDTLKSKLSAVANKYTEYCDDSGSDEGKMEELMDDVITCEDCSILKI